MPKRIVLTGATRGLGRAMAKEFARLGHTVAGCGRSQEGCREMARSLGPPHRFDAVDVSSWPAVEQWASHLLTEFGAPDLLINNAALINRNAPLWLVPAVEFDALMDVNLKGIANTIRGFVPTMIQRGTGVIINFSSYWGRSVSQDVAPYCASKWGVEGLTRALAQDLPAGLSAVPFNPGIIDTDMLRSCFGDAAGGYTSPQEWARAAVPFLLNLGVRENGKPVTAPGQ